MKVIIAAIADHAWVENGCLSLCRAFDSINADKFPYVIPRMSVALRLLVGKSEIGEHKLVVSMTDREGGKLMHGEINMNFQSPPAFVPEASFSFALNGQNIVFAKPGDYAVNVLVGGKAEAAIPLYVRQVRGKDNLDIPDRI